MFRLIFTFLKTAVLSFLRLLGIVCKIVYRALKFLHIRLLTLYVAVCGILAIFLPVFGRTGRVYFWTGFAVCLLVTLLSWVVTVHKKIMSRPHTLQTEESDEEGEAQPQESPAPTAAPEPAPVAAPPQEQVRYPRYFDVEGRAQYFFAEYADRYELYRRTTRGAEYIRTDYKKNISGERHD